VAAVRFIGPEEVRELLDPASLRLACVGLAGMRKALKQRPLDAVREVPLPPALVTRLHAHLQRWPDPTGRVFVTGGGRPPTSTNYGPIWIRARNSLWPAGHPLAETTVYDLRHSAATMMLRAGVVPAEVARRLGHSVEVLMRVYAGVFADERERANALIDAELGRQVDDR
jgi:integrase